MNVHCEEKPLIPSDWCAEGRRLCNFRRLHRRLENLLLDPHRQQPVDVSYSALSADLNDRQRPSISGVIRGER